jgi:cytochrome c-type biogenesis protein CcmH
MMRSRLLITALLLGLTAASAHAVQPEEMLNDPRLEQRARELSQELRCLVCQNQSIDDSNAPLAKDLRLLVRERLKAGDSNPQVIDYLVARYGEFVLLKPRFGWHTLVLWIAPALVLLAGCIGLLMTLRRRSVASGALASAPPLSEAEKAKLSELTKSSGG